MKNAFPKLLWLLSLPLFAQPYDPSIKEDIRSLRNDANLHTMTLRGTSDVDGSDCWARIQISEEWEQPSFFVSVRDENGHSSSMPLVATPLGSNKSLSSDYVHIEERSVPSRSGYSRFATLSNFENGHPTEITVGAVQSQPISDRREMRCYSLKPVRVEQPASESSRASH